MASTSITSSTLEPLQLHGQARPHDVQTTLNYYLDDGKPPAPAYIGKPETYERPLDARPTTIHDVRGHEHEYSVDKQGFQFYKHSSAEKDFVDDAQIKRVYYPETEQLLKDATGATRVHIFDHTIRRVAKDERNTPAAVARAPVQRVHIDQSYRASRSRVPHHLPEEADRLLKTRHGIINVWRPIKKILKDPLGVADAHSVADTELVPVSLIYPDRKGETLSVKHADGHKWYFLYSQDVDEVTLIKCYDSKEDGRARRIPHCAFVDPAHAEDYSRESIEVRAIVFWEDQDEK